MELTKFFTYQRIWDHKIIHMNKIDMTRLQWILQTELIIQMSELISIWKNKTSNGFTFASKRKNFTDKFVDCLQLSVSLGIEVRIPDNFIFSPLQSTDILVHFNQLFLLCSSITEEIEYINFMNSLLGTISMLQLSWVEITKEWETRIMI